VTPAPVTLLKGDGPRHDRLDDSERAQWATAFYGGLRRGELRGLECVDLDFDDGVIRVERGWDDNEGAQDTKTDAGRRAVPMTATLKRMLREHLVATGRRDHDLVFGRTARDPFVASTVRARALRAWGWKHVSNPDCEARPKMIWVKAREDALKPIALHEARHSAASYLIEAGLNDLELTAMIGHSDSRTTRNIYGHLFPDSTANVTAKMDAYFAGAGV
jgi:integrase